MIPIVFITGFLGSGKTTLLCRLAESGVHTRKLVFLVNEFSSLDLDGLAVNAVADEVVSVAGGSIFCRCKTAEFLHHLQTIPERFGGGCPVDGVVVEASGMADPRSARRLFTEAGLDAVYEFRAMVSIADPATFLKLLHTLPVIRAQIAAADRVLVNKCDLHDEEAIAAVEAKIREINPAARCERTTYARVGDDLFQAAAGRRPASPPATAPPPGLAVFVLAGQGRLNPEKLQAFLADCGDRVYRVKGRVRDLDGKPYRLEYSGERCTLETASDAVSPFGLTVFCDPAFAPELRRRVEALAVFV
jgi:G3E family GTPase